MNEDARMEQDEIGNVRIEEERRLTVINAMANEEQMLEELRKKTDQNGRPNYKLVIPNYLTRFKNQVENEVFGPSGRIEIMAPKEANFVNMQKGRRIRVQVVRAWVSDDQ